MGTYTLSGFPKGASQKRSSLPLLALGADDAATPDLAGTADHHIETGIDGEDCNAADVQSRTALETLSRRDWSPAGQAWRKQGGKGGSALKPRRAEDESASLVLNPLALQGAAPPPQEEQGASPGFLRRLGRLMDSTMSSAVSKLYQTPKGAASAGGGDTRAQVRGLLP